MSAGFPDHIDPWRAVKSGLALEGTLFLDSFPRLRSAVVPDDDATITRVDYRLLFERDREGRALVSGVVRSRLRLPCQRCLRDVGIEVESPLRLALVRTDQAAAALAPDLDPLVVTDDSIRPIDLIEDELLLAIPPFPRHAPGDCEPPSMSDDSRHTDCDGGFAPEPDDSGRAPNPFAILEAWKQD